MLEDGTAIMRSLKLGPMRFQKPSHVANRVWKLRYTEPLVNVCVPDVITCGPLVVEEFAKVGATLPGNIVALLEQGSPSPLSTGK